MQNNELNNSKVVFYVQRYPGCDESVDKCIDFRKSWTLGLCFLFNCHANVAHCCSSHHHPSHLFPVYYACTHFDLMLRYVFKQGLVLQQNSFCCLNSLRPSSKSTSFFSNKNCSAISYKR